VAESTTRERMLGTAVRLFRREGYNATSWRRLVDEAGTPWGSAYHHFPGGKEELGVAAVELGSELVLATVRRAFERHETAADAIAWWYRKAGEALAGDGYRDGCPIATLALEMANSSPRLTAACLAAFERWNGVLTGLLQDRGYSAAQAGDLSVAIMNNLQGALILSRVQRSTTPLTQAATHVTTLLTTPTPRK
jgi:TetR/AcrR family transcriptional repressor of lmrAB and yxaGH operons